jgi:hypothetical protein
MMDDDPEDPEGVRRVSSGEEADALLPRAEALEDPAHRGDVTAWVEVPRLFTTDEAADPCRPGVLLKAMCYCLFSPVAVAYLAARLSWLGVQQLGALAVGMARAAVGALRLTLDAAAKYFAHAWAFTRDWVGAPLARGATAAVSAVSRYALLTCSAVWLFVVLPTYETALYVGRVLRDWIAIPAINGMIQACIASGECFVAVSSASLDFIVYPLLNGTAWTCRRLSSFATIVATELWKSGVIPVWNGTAWVIATTWRAFSGCLNSAVGCFTHVLHTIGHWVVLPACHCLTQSALTVWRGAVRFLFAPSWNALVWVSSLVSQAASSCCAAAFRCTEATFMHLLVFFATMFSALQNYIFAPWWNCTVWACNLLCSSMVSCLRITGSFLGTLLAVVRDYLIVPFWNFSEWACASLWSYFLGCIHAVRDNLVVPVRNCIVLTFKVTSSWLTALSTSIANLISWFILAALEFIRFTASFLWSNVGAPVASATSALFWWLVTAVVEPLQHLVREGAHRIATLVVTMAARVAVATAALIGVTTHVGMLVRASALNMAALVSTMGTSLVQVALSFVSARTRGSR